eukprot:5988519-Amphidinium_carterae.1
MCIRDSMNTCLQTSYFWGAQDDCHSNRSVADYRAKQLVETVFLGWQECYTLKNPASGIADNGNMTSIKRMRSKSCK